MIREAMTKSSAGHTWLALADWLICVILRHWLALVLIPLLLFVLLPFGAPLALHVGWTWLGESIYWLYTPFCHQLPQRSWFLFGEKLTYSLSEINQVIPTTEIWSLRRFYGTPELGWKVAWSDRMISFYMLIPFFGLLYGWIRQAKPKMMPLSFQVLIWTLAPLFADGVTHLLNDAFVGDYASGFRDTNAWLRAITGNLFPNFYAGDSLGTFNWWMRLLTGVIAAWGVAFTIFPWLNQLISAEAQRYCKPGR